MTAQSSAVPVVTGQDYIDFQSHLREETAVLVERLRAGAFDDVENIGGLELEACLVRPTLEPACINQTFLTHLNNPQVVPEVATFNVELNNTPRLLTGSALRTMHRELQATWTICQTAARALNSHLLLIGILPTLPESALSLANMTPTHRYYPLNAQVLQVRRERPLSVDIQGHEYLQLKHYDVLLEAATMALQVHLQVAPAHSRRLFNAAMIASAPMVAVAANSPYFLGKDLWDETRIPLFEKSVELGGVSGLAEGSLKRVTFGSGYIQQSIEELFIENAENYPVLLPLGATNITGEFPHLRLHNGTIWRWNRPLIGFADGKPHLRLEHRTMASGTSVLDVIANVAFFVGLVHAWLHAPDALEEQLSFNIARNNFYSAARYGLNTQVTWLNGKRIALHRLILEQFLPVAQQGLNALGIDKSDSEAYLRIIAERVSTRQNGAGWQRAFVAKYGHDMHALTQAYLSQQATGLAVHQWQIT
ncbi:hypothetical protein [Beggiatoa leptomitoformis]|uniref:Glutamate--cysteine ligase n=1 Tax=Beggiatoa leptomitoformis TaxID=288004 RepID=A0A2N9YFL4_9GAMM|nr:hypothetical protein [Beggiatoa leptomitoformis]ALG68350.1 glutamate--cysteine ligase [Beggiatoa leptomitoformis]AUI69331.1 glutamate--cysteine ligase [Beggiatoa leptomitoformis]